MNFIIRHDPIPKISHYVHANIPKFENNLKFEIFLVPKFQIRDIQPVIKNKQAMMNIKKRLSADVVSG